MKLVLVLLIKIYTHLVSPLLAPRCRFYPTCSRYALDCLDQYSLGHALSKIVWRILRCNPFHPGGIDKP
ncbi:MAG: membrane protein insertion efficiency factor YidD [Zetaproteobacteria bacterium]|nr:membrane protein insertion efficiency factor YidD [Pseudobdellovibrionaceae bacterium]